MMEVMTEKKLDKKTLRKSWFTWICFGQICYNYERMMGLGFAHSMIPIFKKLYKDDRDKIADSLTRHLAFYNTENTWGSMILGIVASLEESKANGENVDDDVITGIKTALMGPMAGIGDSVTQALVKVILLAIAVDFALNGSPVGVILFVTLFSAYAFFTSYLMFNSGYKLGKNSVVKLLQGGKIKSLTESFGAVGMMVLGALVANNIRITTPLSFTVGEVVTEVQPMLNQILPNFLNLVLFLGVYHLIRKGKKPNTVILIIFGGAIVFSLLGIL